MKHFNGSNNQRISYEKKEVFALCSWTDSKTLKRSLHEWDNLAGAFYHTNPF